MSKATEQPLVLTGLAQTLTASPNPAYLARKAELLESAACVFSVDDEEEEKAAIAAASHIKALEAIVEKGREAVKKPVLTFGKEIDAKAKEFVKELMEERLRIEGLIATYLAEKRRKLAAEQEEERRRMAKAAEAEAERQREADALAASLGEESRPVEPLPAPVPVALATATPTVAGGAMRAGWDFEVTDVKAFYEAFPLFVKMEIVRSSLLAYLNGGACPKPEAIPGIRAFRKEKFTARAASVTPLIEEEKDRPF